MPFCPQSAPFFTSWHSTCSTAYPARKTTNHPERSAITNDKLSNDILSMLAAALAAGLCAAIDYVLEEETDG